MKKHSFVEANVMNISTKFKFHPLEMTSEYFFANLTFMLPWQPIKFSGLNKIHVVGR